MYQHVIVPFDGGLEARAAFAPAADLAWRFGAKVVVVSTSAIPDETARYLLKSRAISKSGADIDFWVDLDADLGDALLEATRFRADSVICLTSRFRTRGVLRKRTEATPLPEAVLRRSTVPVLVVGPLVDLGRGLPLGEIIMPFDASTEAARAASLAAAWAQTMHLGVRLVHMVPRGSGSTRVPSPVQAGFDVVRAQSPGAVLELIETDRPAAALVAIAGECPDGVICLPGTGAGADGPLGPFQQEAVATSIRPVLFTSAVG